MVWRPLLLASNPVNFNTFIGQGVRFGRFIFKDDCKASAFFLQCFSDDIFHFGLSVNFRPATAFSSPASSALTKMWEPYLISDQGKKLLGVVLPACYCQIHESLHPWVGEVDRWICLAIFIMNSRVAPFKERASPSCRPRSIHLQIESCNFFIILWNLDR